MGARIKLRASSMVARNTHSLRLKLKYAIKWLRALRALMLYHIRFSVTMLLKYKKGGRRGQEFWVT